ncbi:UDP-N-acetylglucosamine transporter YEA4 [Cordyceps javanica]|nr:UDP-N-acetylglucosamine transporter YEA4 [Cordyceps javanica]
MGKARDGNGAENRNAARTLERAEKRIFVSADVGTSALAVLAMLGLVFGGCCSNVYSGSGTLLTFIQFAFVAVTGYVFQFDYKRPPFFLTPTKVPLTRWAVNIVLFFAINVLNNHAFSYNISVPIHIILRSGGSIATMIAGYLYGKRYSKVQVMSVILLSIGVIQAAWSDAMNKSSSITASKPAFGTGLVILLTAQILSAIMGLYTEATYRKYGPQWRENLFYSHILSLPLFLPFAPSMMQSFRSLCASQPMVVSHSFGLRVPSQLVNVTVNILTQYACIRGVNLLAAASSALTVTIVLNIRKLVSLLLSIWLFGNSLAAGTIVGALLVFGGGATSAYSLGGGYPPTPPCDSTILAVLPTAL